MHPLVRIISIHTHPSIHPFIRTHQYILKRCKGKLIKAKDLAADFTFYSLVTGPVHSCAISTPLGAYCPATILTLETYLSHWLFYKLSYINIYPSIRTRPSIPSSITIPIPLFPLPVCLGKENLTEINLLCEFYCCWDSHRYGFHDKLPCRSDYRGFVFHVCIHDSCTAPAFQCIVHQAASCYTCT